MTSPSAEPEPRSKRRWLAPETIQTSAMDCGPATLKSLLEGFGVPVSYGRLREACQTSVDGTSIDTLEDLSRRLGLEAEQVMVPLDHLLLPESRSLPAIVVVRLPSGLTHFVVVWRVHGRWVQVMDPARGRRWMRADALLRDVYVHTMPIPAEMFRDWAGSDEFLLALRRRLARLGAPDGGEAFVSRALADASWRGPAALDAAVRTVAALLDAGAITKGEEAARLCESLAALPPGDPALPARFATASPAPAGDDGTEQVSLRGAVAVRVLGARPLDAGARAELPRELRAAVDEPPARPAEMLFGLLRQDGWLRWSALLGALALAAGGAVLEAVVFRWLFDVAARHAGIAARLPFAARSIAGLPAAAVVALGAVGALLALEWPVAAGLRGAGRRLETRMRRAFLRKIPRLGDRYFGSRPISDMAERAHLTHRLRALPSLGGELVRAGLQLVVTAAALCWIAPGRAPLALALAASMLLIPLGLQPALAERDMRARNHAGALVRFYLDALLGLVAVRTHRAEEALAREHGERLGAWFAAARASLRATLASETLQSAVGIGLAAALFAGYVGSGAAAADPGAILLVVYWALSLPALGQELAALAQQLPGQRNVTLRLIEPLGAPEEVPASAASVPSSATPTGAPRIELRDVVVQAAGHTILTVEALDVAPGEHVAIVGASGAGKSSLVALLLGWHRAASGAVRVDGGALEGEALERLRRATVWVDPQVYLWNRSLHENLAFGLAAAPPSLEEAIAEAELGGVVARLPQGAESLLGEAGALVSGGEGQRVRFGRGVTRHAPRLVVLDEPFRGLARDQRHAMLARARARWAGATLLCVTHDIDETRAFPRVLVIADGRVAEDAAPAELAARAGSRYAALLEAESRVRRAAWSRAASVPWRRLRMKDGRAVAEREAGT
jgi:ATP-binding cassette subfamily B protein